MDALDGRGASAPSEDAAAFDFLAGSWRVGHRKLRRRLAGCTDWESFDGTLTSRPVLGGLGNVDENLLDEPGGAYQALALRLFDPALRRWSIWWVDARRGLLEPPVHGRFAEGVGRFTGEDRLDGRPILVRFLWSGTGTGRPRWEQAFSADGSEWETNWIMQLERAE